VDSLKIHRLPSIGRARGRDVSCLQAMAAATALFLSLLAAAPVPATTSGAGLLRPILGERGLTWTLDPELSWVADRAARALLRAPDATLGPRIERWARGRGLGDPWILPVAVSGSRAAGPASAAASRALWQIVDRVAAQHGVTHTGAAWAYQGRRWTLVVLFTRRPVDWATPVATGTVVRFTGRVTGGRRAPTETSGDLEIHTLGPSAGPLSCRGPATRRTVEAPGPRIAFEVARPPGPGRWVVEVVRASDPLDPVLGWWFFEREEAVASFRPSTGSPGAWLDQLRARARLPAVARDLALTAAAERQAEAVCAGARATHARGSETPADRARAEGVEGPVAENVAVAGSTARAFENLLWSPSHRRTMLDPAARQVGIAVERAGASVCVVQLFGYE
jgi:hypothetical protein